MSKVEDYEVLWRSVAPNFVKSDGADGLVLSSQSFNDPTLKPSVDRSNIRVFKEKSLKGAGHGIVAISAAEIRSITTIQSNPPNQSPQPHGIDVLPDPVAADIQSNIEANPSHALITPHPLIVSKKVFDRLKERLARLAQQRGWILPPNYSGPTTPITDLSRFRHRRYGE